MVQVLRGYGATAQPQPWVAAELSTEPLFYDVQRELPAVSVLVPPARVVAAYAAELSREALCQRLHGLLAPVWTPRWRKAVNAKPRPKVAKAQQSGAHPSHAPPVRNGASGTPHEDSCGLTTGVHSSGLVVQNPLRGHK